MAPSVSLRPVVREDLPILFAHQNDPEATRLAAFPARTWDAFVAHWTTRIIGNPSATSCAILHEGRVAGHIGAWTDASSRERLLCYWLGREFWGRGVASAAVARFLASESVRPLKALVAEHNVGSIRVLEKNGFTRAGTTAFALPDGAPCRESVYILSA